MREISALMREIAAPLPSARPSLRSDRAILRFVFFRGARREAPGTPEKHHKNVRRKVGAPPEHFFREDSRTYAYEVVFSNQVSCFGIVNKISAGA